MRRDGLIGLAEMLTHVVDGHERGDNGSEVRDVFARWVGEERTTFRFGKRATTPRAACRFSLASSRHYVAGCRSLSFQVDCCLSQE